MVRPIRARPRLPSCGPTGKRDSWTDRGPHRPAGCSRSARPRAQAVRNPMCNSLRTDTGLLLKRSMERMVFRASWPRWGAGMTAVVLVACGQPSNAGVQRSSAAAISSGARVSPAPTSPARSPSPGPLPTPTQFASVFSGCRLPVLLSHQQGETPAGWLDVPGGRFTPDPATNAVADKAYGQMAWDTAVGQWVPTDARSISPDGTKYVAPNRSDIEIVDARSGATIHRIATHNWPNYVIAYTSSAIYMGATGQAPPPGLWKVDTGSWTLAQISTADVDWDVADDTAAWGTYGGLGVRRLDLATRRVTELYRADPNRDSGALVAGLVGSGVFVTTFYQGVSGEQLSSVVVVHPDGSVVHVDVPPALRYGSLEKPFQDGPTLLFLAYYPLEPAAPPASLHEWGLAAYDPAHGLTLVMTKAPEDLYFVGRCTLV